MVNLVRYGAGAEPRMGVFGGLHVIDFQEAGLDFPACKPTSIQGEAVGDTPKSQAGSVSQRLRNSCDNKQTHVRLDRSITSIQP
ncbi:hypothetical protein FB593_1205 [Rhizobium sp. SJZ105]|nr:hypothetical protein FB593_1205 [Rhizobium sp. SJZ105]